MVSFIMHKRVLVYTYKKAFNLSDNHYTWRGVPKYHKFLWFCQQYVVNNIMCRIVDILADSSWSCYADILLKLSDL